MSSTKSVCNVSSLQTFTALSYLISTTYLQFAINCKNSGKLHESFVIKIVVDPQVVTISGKVIPLVDVNAISFVRDNLQGSAKVANKKWYTCKIFIEKNKNQRQEWTFFYLIKERFLWLPSLEFPVLEE